MGWRRNLAQRLAIQGRALIERSLEIRPGTPLAARFAAFGVGSAIEGPQLKLVGERIIAIGRGVTILKYACLEAYGPPGAHLIEVGDGCYFSHNIRMVALNGIRIGAHTAIGQYVTLTDTVHDYKRTDGVTWQAPLKVGDPLVIGSGVWIGVGTVVVGGVTIGDGAIIGPNSVITRDVPPRTLVAGNPARIERRRDPGTGAWEPLEEPQLLDQPAAGAPLDA